MIVIMTHYVQNVIAKILKPNIINYEVKITLLMMMSFVSFSLVIIGVTTYYHIWLSNQERSVVVNNYDMNANCLDKTVSISATMINRDSEYFKSQFKMVIMIDKYKDYNKCYEDVANLFSNISFHNSIISNPECIGGYVSFILSRGVISIYLLIVDESLNCDDEYIINDKSGYNVFSIQIDNKINSNGSFNLSVSESDLINSCDYFLKTTPPYFCYVNYDFQIGSFLSLLFTFLSLNLVLHKKYIQYTNGRTSMDKNSNLDNYKMVNEFIDE